MARAGSSSSNVYTILTLIAVLALLVALGYLCMRNVELFGSVFPPSFSQSVGTISIGHGGIV